MPASLDSSKANLLLSATKQGSPEMVPDFQWALILDAVPESISVHSATGEILWVNKRLCDLYGKSFSLLKGLSCQQVFHSEGSTCTHRQVLDTGRGVELTSEVQVSGRTLSVRIEPIFDEHGQTCGFIRVMRDVTSERCAQAQLLTAERFATLGQLLFGIAHDIGTPLNIISGYSEFLLMRTKPDDRGYKELSTILQQTRRIAVLFGEALDLARDPHGRFDGIDIKGFLADALDLVGYYFRKADVKAVLTCRTDSALVYGEAPQLKQAFFNLLLNAGQLVGIGGKLEIVIDDSGDRPGFLTVTLWGTEASGLGHDFSQSLVRFFAAEGETGPVGIGLSLAKQILDSAGAEITSRAAGARGAAVIVRLHVNADGQA